MNQSQQIIQMLEDLERISSPTFGGGTKDMEVLRNPKPGALLALIKNTPRGVVRLLTGSRNMIVWDADQGLHQQVADTFPKLDSWDLKPSAIVAYKKIDSVTDVLASSQAATLRELVANEPLRDGRLVVIQVRPGTFGNITASRAFEKLFKKKLPVLLVESPQDAFFFDKKYDQVRL